METNRMSAYNNNDNLYTQTFTPREYQVELLDTVKKQNTIVCSSTSGAKAFLSVKLVQEFAWQMRTAGGKRSVFILDLQNVEVLESHIKLFTDLPVVIISKLIEGHEWTETLANNAVLLMTADACVEILKSVETDLSFVNILIIDDCLYGERQSLLRELMGVYENTIAKPRIVGLVSGLLGDDMKPQYLDAEMVRLEELLKSSVDTSSELATLIRLSLKPKEVMLRCPRRAAWNIIEMRIEDLVMDAKAFLMQHRYDPSEIYTEEYEDEFLNIPNPTKIPISLLDQFLTILYDLGIYCANNAAYHILMYLEKLKVKVAYERHYLLLCTLSTTMVSVRAVIDDFLEELTDADRLFQCSTTKVVRLIHTLRHFGPSSTERPPPVAVEEAAPVTVPTNRKRMYKGVRKPNTRLQSDESICAVIFVENDITAKVLHHTFVYMNQNFPEFWWIRPLYTSEKTANPVSEAREFETEHRRQEEVLRKFRSHDCNILIATPVMEHGFDLPRCNLVIRFNLPEKFHNYVLSKSRARVPNHSYYISLVFDDKLEAYIKQYSQFIQVENTLLRRCGNLEPSEEDILEADAICEAFAPYKTCKDETVSLTTAIQLINRYCAKLPSDTFTKLVPNYHFITKTDGSVACLLRLPVNSPVKKTVQSPSVKNKLVSRRFAAFYMCQLLHKSVELDDYLNPITKENFRATEEDWNDFSLEREDEELSVENTEQRPGTTKRRQYYYKRIASSLKNSQPAPGVPAYFYKIAMTLTCPIPEEQNTRGRKIYPPEESAQGFGILTSRKIPEICGFPIFTRSGEVNVKLELCAQDISMDQDQIHKIKEFLNYTFTSVLRLQKYQMLFLPIESESNYFIVPTITDDNQTKVDWDFLDKIYINRDVLPIKIPDEERADYVFDSTKYKDAVVMPWYRNQDQPQYFYVAEICLSLNPTATFPGSEYSTFQEYYNRKYSIEIQNKEQYLLDVDHTSARLNFLTPRYVNRKGVALPTSSEETKRAKRENLEQKQILVPELCAIHPFPASLWRKAVCLPCILYRINALLLADEIRRTVANEIGLGKTDLKPDFKWSSLNFGWSLSDVLKKSKEVEKEKEKIVEPKKAVVVNEPKIKEITSDDEDGEKKVDVAGGSGEEEQEDGWKIGTWSNDMIGDNNGDKSSVRYGSPTSWVHKQYGYNEYDDYSDTESYYSSEADTSGSQCGGLHIEFTSDNVAEAIESTKTVKISHDLHLTQAWEHDTLTTNFQEYAANFTKLCREHEANIRQTMIVGTSERIPARIPPPKPKESGIEITDLMEAAYFHEPISYYRETEMFQYEKNVHGFSFDTQPDLDEHPGPSPDVILQALTMSNANDGINLERLETIGDSFLKYAITDYLYSKYEHTHEGKLSHLRSKQVSNLNLYRLGKRKMLGEVMIATKFDPHDNWLPPCYNVCRELEEALMEARVPANYLTLADYVATRNMSLEEICSKLRDKTENIDDLVTGIIPYNLVTQHSIPDKSVADCVEALIGAYLIECGPRGALLFMAWLGIRVLPKLGDHSYGELPVPHSPLLQHIPNPEAHLDLLLNGYDQFEGIIDYKFNDRSYLLQALTHASYYPNEVTDCYQRLEFLGDAVLDYLITRHLYEDQRMHSPGALTDLRSALVNNTIFASLAVRFSFHKYFKYLSPGLHHVIEKFIRMQEEGGYKVSDELFLVDEFEDSEEVEDVEVPKVLGDVFESVAGAIFLDSGRSLDAVWKVYYQMMQKEIEQYSDKVPKSPIRELLELEPETAKFGTAEKLADGRRVRVTVEVFGKGIFKGIGRNYRIAKCTAAKCALKNLKKQPVNVRFNKLRLD